MDLETLEENLFRGQSENIGGPRVFGGQVIGQALTAAVRTVPEKRSVHSLHAYFLRPGDMEYPIIYDVERDLLIYDRKLEKGSGPPIYGLEVCKAMGLDKEFISLARSVQLEITGSDKNFLSDKQSNYNCDIVMDKCQICSEKSEHTHHIKEQNQANETKQNSTQ